MKKTDTAKIPARMTAKWLAAQIMANAEAYQGGSKSYEAFDKDARWLWTRSSTGGFDTRVKAIIRGDRAAPSRNPKMIPRPPADHTTAQWLAERIMTNAESYQNGTRGWDDFDHEAKFLWKKAQAAGLKEQTQKLIRTGKAHNPAQLPDKLYAGDLLSHMIAKTAQSVQIPLDSGFTRDQAINRVRDRSTAGPAVWAAIDKMFPKRNPSSGAKQRARGVRNDPRKPGGGFLYAEHLSGGNSKGARHSTSLTSAAEWRKVIAHIKKQPAHVKLAKESHAGQLALAKRSRPALPNPSSGAKQRARAVRDYRGPTVTREFFVEQAESHRKLGGKRHAEDRAMSAYAGLPYETPAQLTRTVLAEARKRRPALPNPSSGAKQRARGTRTESESLSGYDSAGASHARGMDWAADSRRDRNAEHHAENLEWARANRPALPRKRNPSSPVSALKKRLGGAWRAAKTSDKTRYKHGDVVRVSEPDRLPGGKPLRDDAVVSKAFVWTLGGHETHLYLIETQFSGEHVVRGRYLTKMPPR